MKICFVSISYPRNSNDFVLPSLHVEGKLLAEDHSVDVVASNDTKCPDFMVMDLVKVYRFNYFFKKTQILTHTGGIMSKLEEKWYLYFLLPSFLVSFAVKIFKVAKHCDVIYAHWTPSAFLALPVKILLKRPVVVSLLGGDIRQLPRFFNNFVLRHVDAVIAPTPTIAQYVKESDYKGEIFSVAPCHEFERFGNRVPVSDFLKEQNINPDSKVVTFLGRMDSFKDPITFVKSIPLILKEVSNVTFLIVGFGVLYDQVVALTKELELNDHVKITGPRRDVPVILSASDIFVNLSPEENFLSVAIQEAMALKVACLLTDSGRTAELFTHREFAFLVPPENPQEAAMGITELLRNEDLRGKLQNNGPIFLKKNGCTKEAVKENLKKIFQQFVGKIR